MDRIIEADWKVFREVRVSALERFCERVLSEVCRLATAAGRSSHERYLAVYELLPKKDKQLAAMFDDARRSTAILQLMGIHSQGLLTEDEFGRFSSETRARVQAFCD
jgi:hypothetical protein